MQQDQIGSAPPPSERTSFLGVSFDCLDQAEVIACIRERKPDDPFCYVVTPNVDHIVRLAKQPNMLPLYHRAWLCLCDSKPVQLLSATVRRPLTHVTGSDLTSAIFNSVLKSGDEVTLVVARDDVATKLVARYPHIRFHWHVPPQDLLKKPADMMAATQFIIEHPARLTFIAIGSPQSEIMAERVQDNGGAKGTAFCIGASLEFITGDRRRAPAWMTRNGIEWLHRVATEPRRLWKRYVFSVAPLLRLYWQEVTGRALR